ncbi:MAG: Zn-ribbon domain-containing OB-fold protein [Dehalococcoidia bacterium]|nr:Zn-ribbon domain-containing OB-fold protein [Dehalococcoidia bacterium]MDZ4278328.1 Zn-ribbon domain-containing OB-fold protein [Dehalococcoidia bacterium]
MAEAKRPLPSFPEPDTEPFWEATKQHELRYQVCDACDGIVFFPRAHCPHCLSMSLSWKTSRGEGTIYTFTVVRQIGHPAFREKIPYAVAWIDLDEGFRMLSNVVSDAPDQLEIGQRVRVTWEDQEDGISLPLFTPA